MATGNITFSNFSSPIVLTHDIDNSYFIEGTGSRVELSGDLIVKTSSGLPTDSLHKLHPQIAKITELFTGIDSRFYLVELKDHSKIAAVLGDMALSEHILLAQPDLLQLRRHAESANNQDGVDNSYLEKLDVPSLWEHSRGKGIKIAIIDDGFNLDHPDLKHAREIFSYDAELKILSSRPQAKADNHGTKVAGIIFSAHNNIGIDGLAPEAGLIALRQPATWTSNTILSFQVAKLAGADIINCSWNSRWLLQPIADIVDELSRTGREGKGIAIVFSAGNRGQEIKHLSSESSLEQAIVVGAKNHMGRKYIFSNYGKTVDFFMYGNPALTTTGDGHYGAFSGTSLAAAITSGYIALLLGQDDSLSLDQIINKLQEVTSTHD